MVVSTEDCVKFLIDWTVQNYDSIPKSDWNFVGEKRLKVLSLGHTRTSNWKRRAIKTHNDKTYRLFECKENLFHISTMFLVTEESGAMSVIAGSQEDFEQYFNSIGYNWGGWSK
jgi:hypothetical protein